MPATLDIVGDGRRRLSEIFACAYKLLFRFVRQGLPNVNLNSDSVHVYPYLFMHFGNENLMLEEDLIEADFDDKKEARRPKRFSHAS